MKRKSGEIDQDYLPTDDAKRTKTINNIATLVKRPHTIMKKSVRDFDKVMDEIRLRKNSNESFAGQRKMIDDTIVEIAHYMKKLNEILDVYYDLKDFSRKQELEAAKKNLEEIAKQVKKLESEEGESEVTIKRSKSDEILNMLSKQVSQTTVVIQNRPTSAFSMSSDTSSLSYRSDAVSDISSHISEMSLNDRE